MSAVDPASPCALGIVDMKALLPRRTAGNYLVFHGAELLLTIENRGRRLGFHVDAGDGRLADAFRIFDEFLERADNPWSKVEVETINDEVATESVYAELLKRSGFRKEMKKLIRGRIY
jgi:hypothetical protein